MSTISLSLKNLYVRTAGVLRGLLGLVGLLPLLDRWAQRSRIGLWVRSLLSPYRFDDLVALDVPWWTLDSTEQVDSFLKDRPQARVFEWGSGASTVWLAKRAGTVTSIEHDPEWAGQVAPQLPANASVHVRAPRVATGAAGEVLSAKNGFAGLDFSAYAAAVTEHAASEGTYDLIVVDGRAREACFAHALTALAPDGVLVFDNVDRARYRDAIDEVSRRQGIPVEVTWTRGLTPTLPYPTRTALVRRAVAHAH